MRIDGRSFEILLVEDNPGDVRPTREALKDVKMKHNMHHVMDGKAAIHFMERSGKYAKVPTPDLILLDLNLPKLGGHEVLEYLKTNAELKHIPVVVLSTSQAATDVHKSHARSANGFVSKPPEFEKYMEAVANLWNLRGI